MISVSSAASQLHAASQQSTPVSPEAGGNPGGRDISSAQPQGEDNKRDLPKHHQAAPTPPTKDDKLADSQKPESAQLLISVMSGALILEFVHQVFSFILAVLNFDVLKATAKRTVGEESAFSDTLINLTAWGSLALTTLISLIIIGVLALMVWLFNKKSKHAGTARRMLFVFSLYFTFRLFLVFMTRPATGTDSPDWLYVIDGSLQILVGVAAVLVIVFANRAETLEYTGEMEKLRQFEQEQKKLQEQRAREAKEKLNNSDKSGKAGKNSSKVQDEEDYGTFKGMIGRWFKGGKSRGDKDDNDKNQDSR